MFYQALRRRYCPMLWKIKILFLICMVNLMLKTKDKWEGSLIRADPIFAGISFAVLSAPPQKARNTLISSCVLYINYCSQTLRGEHEGCWKGARETILDPGDHKHRDWCCRAIPDGQEEEFWVLSALVGVTAVRCAGHGMTGIKFTLG